MKHSKRDLTVTYETVERMTRPTVGRFQQTTHHRPRNTKGNLRRSAARANAQIGG